MKMFATLVGTDTSAAIHQPVFERLTAAAVARGFVLPDTTHRVRPNQLALDRWALELRGPAGGRAAFFLAVTAPRVPGIAPIPVTQTIDGPLFAVVAMPTFFSVSAGRDFTEHKDAAEVVARFDAFLDSLTPHAQ
jgi:hypothetical protein